MKRFAKELSDGGLGWNDYERMQTEHRAPGVHRRIDYSWAFNDGMVQKVIAAHIATVAFATKLPTTIDQLKALDTVALHYLSKSSCKNVQKAVAAARRLGGLAAYDAALIYHAFRLGENSVQVSEALKVSPQAVRVALYRLNAIAKKLVAGTFSLVTKKRSYPYRPYQKTGRKPTWDHRRGIAMRAEGLSFREVGAALGVSAAEVCQTLGKLGVHHPRARRCCWKGQAFSHTEAMDFWRDGWSIRELAEHYGVSKQAIIQLVNKSPLAEPRPKPRGIDMRTAIRLRFYGLTIKEIAQRLGVPWYRVEYKFKGIVVPMVRVQCGRRKKDRNPLPV